MFMFPCLLLCDSRVACLVRTFFFFFKQKTAYEMRISDWSSDVCSSDLPVRRQSRRARRSDRRLAPPARRNQAARHRGALSTGTRSRPSRLYRHGRHGSPRRPCRPARQDGGRTGPEEREQGRRGRSEEHTSELQSLMRISYAVFCLKKKNKKQK